MNTTQDTTRETIGSRARAHLEVINIDNGGVQIAVIAANAVLLGYAWIGPTEDGYRIHRKEVWGRRGERRIGSTVLRLLSVARLHKLLAAA